MTGGFISAREASRLGDGIDLIQHLRGLQIPDQPSQGGGAECTSHPAAHLRGNTDAVAVPVLHPHTLHQIPVPAGIYGGGRLFYGETETKGLLEKVENATRTDIKSLTLEELEEEKTAPSPGSPPGGWCRCCRAGCPRASHTHGGEEGSGAGEHPAHGGRKH